MKTILLAIGHSKTTPGAGNKLEGVSEFEFNEQLAKFIEAKNFTGVKIIVFYRGRFKNLADDINAFNPDLIISLHCNAFNEKATGTETLYYYKSSRSKLMAEIFQKHIVNYLGLPNRGIKPKQVEDRGGALLKYTNAPCIICEPFFIDNNLDFARGSKDMDALSDAYSKAIVEAVQRV